MNHTQNYHLPQWEKSDRVMMDDFNQMCNRIESGIISAENSAKRAQDTAEQLPYVIGTYTGNGKTQDVEIGFRPSFLIISGPIHHDSGSANAESVLIGRVNNIEYLAKITDQGVTVTEIESFYPHLNWLGVMYNYIAFR